MMAQGALLWLFGIALIALLVLLWRMSQNYRKQQRVINRLQKQVGQYSEFARESLAEAQRGIEAMPVPHPPTSEIEAKIKGADSNLAIIQEILSAVARIE